MIIWKKTIVLCKKKTKKKQKKQTNKQTNTKHYGSLPKAMELSYYRNKTIIIYKNYGYIIL